LRVATTIRLYALYKRRIVYYIPAIVNTPNFVSTIQLLSHTHSIMSHVWW